MADFNRNSNFKRSSGRSPRGRDSGGFGGRRDSGRRFNDRDSEPFERRSSGRSGSFDRDMHKVICNKCGEKCEVPFKPSGDKPVYCNECFRNSENNPRSNRSDEHRAERPDQNNEKFDEINQKLDRILKALQLD